MQVVLTVAALVPESGGPSRSIPALADALAGQGRDVSVAALDFEEHFSAPLLPRNPDVKTSLTPCRTPFVRATRYSRDFTRTVAGLLARQPGKSVLHDNGVWLGTNYLASRVAKAKGAPLVVSPRGMLTGWAVRQRGAGKRLAWWLYQRRALAVASLLHATSEDEAEDLRRMGCRQPIAVIPNGVTLPDQITRPARTAKRRALFLSRVHPKKGLLDLVAAWSELRPAGWELVIVGDDEGGHAAEIETAIQAAGLGAGCRLAGGVRDEDKWDQYAAADLFVLPSYSENFGLVVAEALGCGVPVITTTATPWTEVESRRCGWCIAPGCDALRAALSPAFSLDAGALREMGERGSQWVRAEFSWRQAARKLGEAYDFLLGTGDRPNTIR